MGDGEVKNSSMVPIQRIGSTGKKVATYINWTDYYDHILSQMPKEYKLGENYEEILPLKTIINRYFLPSYSKLDLNETADENFFKGLEVLSIACGVKRKNYYQIEKEHICALKNPEDYDYFKNTDLYLSIKTYGLSDEPDRTNGIKNWKKERIEASRRKLEQTTNKTFRQGSYYGQELSWLAIKKITAESKEHNYDADKVISIIRRAAKAFDLDPNFIAAMMEVESTFNPEGKSDKKAYGLMQVTDIAYKDVIENYKIDYKEYQTDILENIFCGAAYLKICLNKLDSNVSLAIAGYNAGWPTIQIYNGIPPGKEYEETRKHVPKVKRAYEEYKKHEYA